MTGRHNPNVRIRPVSPGKYVVEAKTGCCDWSFVDPQTLDKRLPVMSYEDWMVIDGEQNALEVERKYNAK